MGGAGQAAVRTVSGGRVITRPGKSLCRTAPYLLYGTQDKKVSLTSLYFRDLYKPTVDQVWMPNQCWTMLPYNVGLERDENGSWSWSSGVTGQVYNIGDGLMASGVKAVLGYISPATPEAITQNTLPYFRRMFGGYFSGDKPPAPHTFWPVCMSTQTFFRLPQTPQLAVYANKWRAQSLYTMYAVNTPLYQREACAPAPNAHAAMASFMLKVGTPATALPLCWDQYWSKGEYPSGLVDPLCSQGDNPTTSEATQDAACGVKVARAVTNAMLTP